MLAPSASPARKRQRLSSPDYEVGSWEFDEDAIQEISRIELTLSQLIRNQEEYQPSSQSQRDAEEAKKRRLAAIKAALGETTEGNDDGEEVAGSSSQLQSSPTEKRKREVEVEGGADLLHEVQETTSQSIPKAAEEPRILSPSPDYAQDTENDYSKFFDPADMSALPGFQKLSKIVLDVTEEASSSAGLPGFAPAGKNEVVAGFASASLGTQSSAWLEPSKEALELAARKMQDWSKDDEELHQQPVSDDTIVADTTAALTTSQSHAITRPVLASVSNSPAFTPPSFSRPVTPDTSKGKEKTNGFKSPLMGTSASRTLYPKALSPGVQNMPLHYPGASRDPAYIAKVGRIPHPLSSTPITAPPDPSPASPGPSRRPTNASFSTPVRSGTTFNTPGSVKSRRQIKTTFTTPFKPGMRPGEPGHATLQQQKPHTSPKSEPNGPRKSEVQKKGRITLKDSGLKPQRYKLEELQDMGLNASELSRINPRTASFYTFYRLNPQTSLVRYQPNPFIRLGPEAALVHLLQTGHKHASQEWVSNAYVFVLWKLAGLAQLEPHREDTPERRWCWEEVLRQLEAKYKKEIEDGVRPPLRVIASGDKTPEAPMVLLVTDILDRDPKTGLPVHESKVEIEVSDGWYRLRATIDGPLRRAVRQGKIRVGRKIAVAGSKIISPKKEAMEILQAYDILAFQLRGNGTHLAPWHAKLGFQETPYISTLNSLTADGGNVVLMDLVIEKVHPIGFQEIIMEANGTRRFEDPRCEADEAAEESRWKARREDEETKLRDVLQARWARWDGLADRLEAAAGGAFKPSEDDMPPDNTEDLFDDLDDTPASDVGTFIRRLSAAEAGWLSRFIRSKAERDKELAMDEIESELKTKCPPREVRSFRIVVVRDAQTVRRSANRRALLTIWDVTNLQVTEGAKPGAIEEGQRFLITNLIPCQQKSWMGTQEGSQVFLATTRQSRITRIR